MEHNSYLEKTSLLTRAVWLVLTTVVLVSPASIARAERLAPSQRQALLLLRVLSYDRNIEDRVKDTVTVAVLYDPKNKASVAMQMEMVAAIEMLSAKVTVSGRVVRVVSVPYERDAKLFQQIRGAAAVYVCSGLDDHVSAISEATQRESVLSVTGQKGYVKAGLSIGIVSRGRKFVMLVNLEASRSEGVSLSAAFLAVAEMVEN